MAETTRLTIQIKDIDNVAVAVHDLPAGTVIECGVTTLADIPQAHKIALTDIPAGGEIIRYGVVLGYAKADIPAGSWINEHMLQAILDMADKKLRKLNLRQREELPLSDLLVGMQCGGSDAFSGITANPSAGYAADLLVRGGGTVLFSEVTEVRDDVQMLAARCPDAYTRDRLTQEMKWYDDYLAAGGVGRDANPTPGNKKGGLANIVEKAMGSIAKSGTSPIVEVLSPAAKPTCDSHGPRVP